MKTMNKSKKKPEVEETLEVADNETYKPTDYEKMLMYRSGLYAITEILSNSPAELMKSCNLKLNTHSLERVSKAFVLNGNLDHDVYYYLLFALERVIHEFDGEEPCEYFDGVFKTVLQKISDDDFLVNIDFCPICGCGDAMEYLTESDLELIEL